MKKIKTPSYVTRPCVSLIVNETNAGNDMQNGYIDINGCLPTASYKLKNMQYSKVAPGDDLQITHRLLFGEASTCQTKI